MIHCSTVQERIEMVSRMVANPSHGLVSQLSRTHDVSRQTLYRWTARGVRALEEALGGGVVAAKQTASVQTLVLTLLIETHASYRGIQSCLRSMHGINLSLGKIAGIVKEAGHRAQSWLNHQQATTARTLALDEQYSSQRGKAYLNVVDVHSGQVWASVPPVEVDGESWTLLLWYLQEQGISRLGTVSPGRRESGSWAREPPTRCLASLPCRLSSPGTPRSCGENRTRPLGGNRAAGRGCGRGKTSTRKTSQGHADPAEGSGGSDQLCGRWRALSLSAMA